MRGEPIRIALVKIVEHVLERRPTLPSEHAPVVEQSTRRDCLAADTQMLR